MLLAAHSDRIELLETKTNRVDQLMAARAHLIRSMHGQPFAIRDRFRFFDWRQVGIYTRRRGRHLLTKELLANKKAAAGGRSLIRFARKREKERLAEESAALGCGRQFHAFEISRGRR